MDFEDMMPVGECVVCNTQLDHSEAGFCKSCGGPFCWSTCGGWHGGEHCCDICKIEIDSHYDDET